MHTAKQKHDLYENNLIKPYYYLSHWNQPHGPSADRDAGLGQSARRATDHRRWSTIPINFNRIWTTCRAASHCTSPRSDQSGRFFFLPRTKRHLTLQPIRAARHSNPLSSPAWRRCIYVKNAGGGTPPSKCGAKTSFMLCTRGLHVAPSTWRTWRRLFVVKLWHCNAFSARQEEIKMLPIVW